MSSRGATWSRPVLVLLAYLGLAAAALVWGAVRGHANVWRLAGVEHPRAPASAAAGLALGLLTVFLSRLAVHRFEWARALHREFRALLGPMGTPEIVVLAVASSLGEELFFRGALMPVVGVWLSSAIFALLHIGPRARYLPWTLGSFGAGLAFGGLFLWSGDLSGPVLAHFTINFLNLRHLSRHELP